MLDSDDADGFFLIALFTNGPVGWIFLVLAIIVGVIVWQNEDECSHMHCDHGQPILANNECLCVEKAK